MKLYIANISYGDDPQHSWAMRALVLRLTALGIPFIDAQPFWDSLIPRGRNRAAHAFLKSDATHLLSIDTDVIFKPYDVERLITSNLDFVGAPYPVKAHGVTPNFIGVARPGGIRDRAGFVEAQDVGTGFLLLSRRVFERLQPYAPKYRSDLIGGEAETCADYYGTGVYDVSVEDSQYLSEDWFISRAYTATGGTCYLDGEAKLGHVGRCVWQMGDTLNAALDRDRLAGKERG